MKRLIVLAILTIVATIGLKAQTPTSPKMETATDSISVLFQQLERTNEEVAYLNERLRIHSQFALGSFVLEGIGVACLLSSSSNILQGFSEMDRLAQLGFDLCVIGGIGFVLSYIPIWTKKIKIDERGLIIPLN